MKTFKLQITEEELVALISYQTRKLGVEALGHAGEKPTVDTAQRIVELTRRLNKETPEIEGDPRLAMQNYNNQVPSNGQIEAGKENTKIPEGW